MNQGARNCFLLAAGRSYSLPIDGGGLFLHWFSRTLPNWSMSGDKIDARPSQSRQSEADHRDDGRLHIG
ncbi:hypothetical protein [Cupriavidus consociatus]|uniref:hypothetical protein n=1 Tax=Cupriavidus consociatus TaxID=2821357 RepID=UPI001AE7D7CF|nr:MULTISPECIES: hypothetical protein [unclassified Cupriavidus]MBP0620838.1 hypothetical protein [Cupriavidus sp. LEh25]MDK2657500.1 hypothetical protein [Cupriavidus sp. LEh21]